MEPLRGQPQQAAEAYGGQIPAAAAHEKQQQKKNARNMKGRNQHDQYCGAEAEAQPGCMCVRVCGGERGARPLATHRMRSAMVNPT